MFKTKTLNLPSTVAKDVDVKTIRRINQSLSTSMLYHCLETYV